MDQEMREAFSDIKDDFKEKVKEIKDDTKEKHTKIFDKIDSLEKAVSFHKGEHSKMDKSVVTKGATGGGISGFLGGIIGGFLKSIFMDPK